MDGVGTRLYRRFPQRIVLCQIMRFSQRNRWSRRQRPQSGEVVPTYELPNATVSGEPTCIEFFAGIGLTHLGLSAHGWKCLYANDIEPKKRRMYETCFGSADHYHVEDVWKTDKILERIPPQPVDLATASFPCVDLSLAGNLKGLSGSQSGAFYGFIKVMKRLREQGRAPRAVLVGERHRVSQFARRKVLPRGTSAACRSWLLLGCIHVDAKHFTPQSRPRLFIVAFEERLLPEKRHQDYLFDRDTLDSFRENPKTLESALRPDDCSKN